jgi:uncharacterized protein (DUF1330 family)
VAAYCIARVLVTNPEAYPDYTQLSGPAVAKYGGRFLIRGGRYEVLEGGKETRRIVVIEFDTLEQARTWYSSPDYEVAKAVRQTAAISEFLLIEGA